MKHLTYIFIIPLIAIVSACQGTSVADSLRNIDEALAQGDMRAAHSVAEKLMASDLLDGLSASELARLSIDYMQMADNEEENSALVATAADLYRRACQANADSARAFYDTLGPDEEALASQLFHIVAATDSAGVIPPDGPRPSDTLPD